MSEETQNTNGTQTTTEQTPTTTAQPVANKFGTAMTILWCVFGIFFAVLIVILIISAIKFLRKRANG